MTDLRKILGKDFDFMAKSRAAVYRNSKTGKTLAFLLTDLPEGKEWRFIKVEELPKLKNTTAYDRIKRLNEGKYGVVYRDGQVHGV
jgi:hypothetical protein